MSDITSKSIATLKSFGIVYAPLKKASNHMQYENAEMEKIFPFDWYSSMEQCELRVGSTWRREYIYNGRRSDRLFYRKEQTRYKEWLDIHKHIFQVLEEHIRDTLEVKSFDVVAILASLWPFLPWEPSEDGVSGDRQSTIPPCAGENPVSRKPPMKSWNQDMTQHGVVSDWLFPAHRFFPYTGRDIRAFYYAGI
jgi:hypothetical protein